MLSTAPEQIEQAIRELPPTAQMELAQFIDYLRYKYSDAEPPILALEGLWADVDFEVNEDDVRRLREEISSRLVETIWGEVDVCAVEEDVGVDAGVADDDDFAHGVNWGKR